MGTLLKGRIDHFRIQVKYYEANYDEYSSLDAYHSIQLWFPQALPYSFSVYSGSSKKQHILTGDPGFDCKFAIAYGNQIRLTALFNQTTMDLCSQLAGTSYYHFYITNTGIKYHLKDKENPEQCIQKLVALARQITTPFDPAKRLYQGFHHRDQPSARVHCLALLLTHFPGIAEEKHLYAQAMADASPHVNFQAFRLSGEKQTVEQLHEIWEKSDPDLQMQILDFVGAKKAMQYLPFLITCCRQAPLSIYLAILQVIEHLADPAANDFLLEQLAAGGEQKARAAIAALGSCGNPAVIRALLEVRDKPLLQAARKAVNSINSRFNLAKGGQLSIAVPEPRGGELSITGTDAEGAPGPEDTKS